MGHKTLSEWWDDVPVLGEAGLEQDDIDQDDFGDLGDDLADMDGDDWEDD